MIWIAIRTGIGQINQMCSLVRRGRHFRDYQLINVVVFGLSAGNGGLEIWSRDDRDELTISGAYYKGLDSFEYISQFVRFPKGAGLPGNSWKNNRPGFLSNPNINPNFIRSFDRDPANIIECVGLPIGREYGFPASVLLFLSDETTPFAKSINVWRCETSDDQRTMFSRSISDATEYDAKWCQKICDQFQHNPATVIAEPNSDLLDSQGKMGRAGIFVPFFNGTDITDVLAITF
jgi:hypothetical protein